MLNPRGDGGISLDAAMQQLKHSVMAAKTTSGASAEPGFEHVPILRTPKRGCFQSCLCTFASNASP